MERQKGINSTLNRIGTIIFNDNLDKKITDPFQRPLFLLVLILISFGFIFYAIYYFMKRRDDINVGYSYYGDDITKFMPLFDIKTEKLSECIDRCKKDPLCQGITYNNDTKKCLGTKNGKLRPEDDNYTSWVKKHDLVKQLLVKDNIILGYTNKQSYVSSTAIERPMSLGNFCFGFNIKIDDFYDKFGKWRHVFHKGTRLFDTNNNGITINYQNWENIVSNFPNQCIGVWLAPFTNNLRIAVSTISYESSISKNEVHAFIQKCNSLTEECYNTANQSGSSSHMSDGSVPKVKIVKNLEYIDGDIQDIPIGKEMNICINFYGNTVELYINSKILKVYQLEGIPEFNDEDLYIMNPITFKGELSNLVYLPNKATMTQIKDMSKL